MRISVPRVLLTAVLTVMTTACATTTTTEARSDGSRYRVLVPTFQATGGASERDASRVAGTLRNLIADMATHTAVPERELRTAMAQYEVEQLTNITARQLAQQINAQLVSWGTVEQGGAGLQADVTFTDVRSGDELVVEDVTGADAGQLAQAIFQELEQQLQGIRQAVFCNDYVSSEQYERALANCEQALAIVPRSVSALYGKATALYNLERYEESLETYQRLLEIDPAHQEGLYGTGLAASQLGQRQVAMDYYNRYLELNPTDVGVRMTVAGDIAETGDVVSAFRILEPAAEDNADNQEFQQYLFQIAAAAGQRAREEGGPEEARPYFEQAQRAYERAFASGEVELDVASLRQAIAVSSNLGDTDRALRLAEQATERFDDVPGIWSAYATLLTDLGRDQEAIEALSRVVQLDPNYENAYLRRAQARLRAGQRQAAVQDLERAAERGNSSVVGQLLAAEAGKAFNNDRLNEATELASLAARYAEGEALSTANFIWGFSLYRQAEAIARGNAEERAEPARRALALFQRAKERLRQSNNANAPQVIQAADQYITNQEAIIGAASRR